MQSEGYSLGPIKRIIDAIPQGHAADVLDLDQAIRAAWTEEEAEVVDVAELAGRTGGDPDPELVRRAAEMGIIRMLDEGSPSSRIATPRIFVCRPWPISVPP